MQMHMPDACAVYSIKAMHWCIHDHVSCAARTWCGHDGVVGGLGACQVDAGDPRVRREVAADLQVPPL